jgi:hypothetical protein
VVQATSSSLLADTDGDFLPDIVEWAVLTNPTEPDTDGDGVPDFVEVVQRGHPREPGKPIPYDHEMRIVVTAPAPGSPDDTSWMHLLVRFAEEGSPVEGFATWFETQALPELKIPLDAFFFAGMVVAEQEVPGEGIWLRISAPLVSASLIQMLLPCSICAQAFVGGRFLQTEVDLIEVQNMITTIVPFREGQFAVQTIAPLAANLTASNKVCVLELSQVGAGPTGSVFEVSKAECQDCNDLECGTACNDAEGWIVTLPCGLSALTGE